MVGHGLAEGGLNQAPAHIGERELRDEQLFPFEAAVRRSRHRQRDAGLLRRGRRALPRLDRAARRHPPRRVGLRRHRRVGLHRRRDDLDRAPAHGRPRRGGAAGAGRRRRRGAAADGRLRLAARGRPRRAAGSTTRSSTPRSARDPPDEVPARAVRPAVRPDPGRGRPRRARRRRGAGPPVGSPSARWSWSRTTGSCRSRPDIRRVAVIGPIADSARDLLGDYSHLVHMETLREMRDGADALGIVGDGEVIEPDDELTGRRTILDALRDALVGAERPLRPRHRDLRRDATRRSPPPWRSPGRRMSRSSSSASAPA